MMSLYIESAGAITALGHDVYQTVASIRSGLDRFRETPHYGSSGEDLKVARIEGYAEGLSGSRRYLILLLKAIRPCFMDLTSQQRNNSAILIGLPYPNRPGTPDGLTEYLKSNVSSTLDISPEAIHFAQLGRASVFWSMNKARELLYNNQIQSCIVGGVDSLINSNSLRLLSHAGAIKEEWDGFIPGEAAAFVRLSRKSGPGVWGKNSASIVGVGIATEKADGTAKDPLVGVGINNAFRAAMKDARLPEDHIHLCINDINGSRAGSEDDAMGRIRFFRSPRQHLEIWHPASYLGETGAAVGAIELIWASAALELGFSPGTGILASSSDGNLRTAVFLRKDMDIATQSSNEGFTIGNGLPALHTNNNFSITADMEDPGLRISDTDNLQKELIEDNFDELSWLNSLRNTHHKENRDPWLDIEDFERRLVTHLDALAWSRPVSTDLAETFLLSADMENSAAAAMVLLSVPLDKKHQDLIHEAITESDERCDAICSVLPHMPRINAEPILIFLMSAGSVYQKGCAIKALTIGGWINEKLLKPLFDNTHPELAGIIIESAGASGLPQFWQQSVHLLETFPDMLTDPHILGALSICQQNFSIKGINQQELLNIAPLSYAFNCLREGTSFINYIGKDTSLSPGILDAIGWSGEQAAKSLLLDSIESGNNTQKTSAANALYRIFGLAPYEEIEIPDLETYEPEISEITGDDTDTDIRREMIEIKRLSHKRNIWEDALSTFEKHPMNIRLRHGEPWTNKSALRHLHRPDPAFGERLSATWEYTIINRAPFPLYPSHFVIRQKAALNKLSS